MKNKLQILSASIISLLFLSSFTFSTGKITFADDETKKKRVITTIDSTELENLMETTLHDFDFKIIHEKIDSVLENIDIQIDSIESRIIIVIKDSIRVLNLEELKNCSASFDSRKFEIHCKMDSLHREVFVFREPGNHKLRKIVIPPMPPLPPMPKFPKDILNENYDRYSFDPDDKDIISYDKKDMRNGREKIVIVRKKKKIEN
jgi:hypothetical protein